jgi:hypothetical protein
VDTGSGEENATTQNRASGAVSDPPKTKNH